jgi:hypothetical protein
VGHDQSAPVGLAVPALNGQTVMTIRNAAGATVIEVTMSYNLADGTLRNATVITSTGSKSGALVADNLTGRAVRVFVTDPVTGVESRTFPVPANGAALTLAQLAALPVPMTTVSQLGGLTFDLA